MIFVTAADFKAEEINRVSQKKYDAVIVGGGTSGLIAALTLIERGKTVALIEAGPFSLSTHLTNTEVRFQPELGRTFRRNHQYTQKLTDGTDFGPNLSCLGGRGMFWNGAAPRFQKHDFSGWPISLDDMIPYYEWMEGHFRVTNQLGETPLGIRIIEKISNSTSLKATAAPFAFNDTKYFDGMVPSGVSSGLAVFLRNTTEQTRKDAIDIFSNSFATDITWQGDNANGVNVILNGNINTHLNCRSVIVACGAIESAKLLANSKISDPYARIGIGIQEHIFYRSFWNGAHLFDKDRHDIAAVFIPSTEQTTEQVEIHAPGEFLFATDSEVAWQPADIPRYEIMIRSFAATRKTDDNYAGFPSSTLGGALIHFSHSSFETTLKDKMKQTVSQIGEALDIRLARDSFASFGGSYHEAGGLDMGDDVKISVTDKHGRVHTMENIYVVDASAFPRIGATNPHLTIGAMSRKQTLNMPL